MQATSQTYKNLLAAGAPKEVQAIIAGTTYTQAKIMSASVSAAVESEAATVGNTVAKTLNLVLRNPGEIPRMAQIQMQYRLNDGTTQSEWIPKGTFFIDTRDEGNGVLSIVAYDAMLKADQPYATSGEQGGWPRVDINVAQTIASRIGTTFDSRNVQIMTARYSVPFPGYGDGAYSMREVLGYIGAMYAGNWIVTDQNTLRLIQLGDIPTKTDYLVTETGDYILIGGYRILV